MLNLTGEAGKSVHAYFPPGVWYDWYSHNVISPQGSETITINTPFDIIPVCNCYCTYDCACE